MNDILTLIRIRHWVKNLFLFIPVFFAGELFNLENIQVLVVSFICFSLIASSIYIINDYFDRNLDRFHPEKKNRPLASGKVSVTMAFVVCVSFLVVGLVITLYFFINLGYSIGLKNISILDIMLVATGFLLRTIAGGILINVPISKWLLIIVYLLALFLVLAKRLDDFEKDGKVSRKTVRNYNRNFIHSGITMISGIITLAYIMYTISDDVMQRMHSEHLYITSIFVIAGIMRYLQITIVENRSGSPTEIFLTDRFIFLTLVGWILSFFIIIY
jgi:decaprenyl-phosphate phosphoribosyltransferase